MEKLETRTKLCFSPFQGSLSAIPVNGREIAANEPFLVAQLGNTSKTREKVKLRMAARGGLRKERKSRKFPHQSKWEVGNRCRPFLGAGGAHLFRYVRLKLKIRNNVL